MSRTVPPQACTLDGIPLELVRVIDEAGRSWVQHLYPNRDGVEFEDQGRLPARYTVHAQIRGPGWLSTVRALRQVIEAPARLLTFVHPFWGVRLGQLGPGGLRITHFDRKHDFVELRFAFVEGTLTPFVFSLEEAVTPAAVAQFETAIAELTTAVAAVGT